MEMDMNVMFNACAHYYELYELCKDGKDGGKLFRAKYCAIFELIKAYDLDEQFRKYMAERKSNS